MSVEAFAALTLALAVPFAALTIVVIFGLLMGRPSKDPLKDARYEAGNPPHGKARSWIPMQYYGYLILFLALEPILVLLYLYPEYMGPGRGEPSILVVVLAIMSLPLIYGLRQAREIGRWRMRMG